MAGGARAAPTAVGLGLGLLVAAGCGDDYRYTADPYRPDSPWADVLQPCLQAGPRESTPDEACTWGELPPIGDGAPRPTIDDVMDRVVVSHTWMGDNFRRYLEVMPPEILPLFGSVTGVVIAWDIRPSHFRASTGGLYLDAGVFWLTRDELEQVSDEPDYRAGFGAVLPFRFGARLVRGGERLVVRYDEDGRRSFEDMQPLVARLLVHELAHAMDYLPLARIPALDASARIDTRRFELAEALDGTRPLASTPLRELADVLYRGDEATEAQRQVEPAQVGAWFAGDGASHMYAYASPLEDLAMLYESVWMQRYYDVDWEVAVTSTASEAFPDVTIAWGELGRIAAPSVLPRAGHVVELVDAPDAAALNAHLEGLLPPVPLVPGSRWSSPARAVGGLSRSGEVGGWSVPAEAIFRRHPLR